MNWRFASTHSLNSVLFLEQIAKMRPGNDFKNRCCIRKRIKFYWFFGKTKKVYTREKSRQLKPLEFVRKIVQFAVGYKHFFRYEALYWVIDVFLTVV